MTSTTPVASYRHTGLMTAAFLVFAVVGARAARGLPAAGQSDLIGLYLTLIAAEWALVYWVWTGGLARSGTSLAELIGGRWTRARDVALDVTIGLAIWAGLLGADRLLASVLPHREGAIVAPLLPVGAIATVLWISLSLSAGFGEELVFRGYFLRQFSAFTHHRWAGLILQAVLFGISHGYQGATACARIALYGCALGGVALWRHSLRPGMIAHAWTDIASGLLNI